MITFACSKEDHKLAQKIAARAHEFAKTMSLQEQHPKAEILMDIVATHVNGCPLNLSDLAETDNFNFAHDVFGIRRHLNRETGRLGGCFVPRYALPSAR